MGVRPVTDLPGTTYGVYDVVEEGRSVCGRHSPVTGVKRPPFNSGVLDCVSVRLTFTVQDLNFDRERLRLRERKGRGVTTEKTPHPPP